ncbi:MAG TPA: LacI family DNA-binding transcriptional regulator [Chitinophagaceae bacterium]|jgi:LacI family transcriptional regulator|nr:LacI family DNA-binding transcriptional regulator [Chitinophagaceae bacterium]
MNSVTLKKLAEELNMSPSTVSRALRDSHEISQETKDRVKALADKLDFQPNPHASSLRKNKSKTIAVIVPEIQNNFFSQVMNGVEEIARQKGYHVLIYLTHEDHKRESDILHLLRNGRVEGVMISVSNTTKSFEHLEACQQADLPLLFFDRVCESMEVPCVTTDDAGAAFKATEHLLKAGCHKIAFLSMAENLSISCGRKSGYLKALAKYGLTNKETVIECGPDDETNRQKIRQLLQSENRPDSIFAAVEKFAVNTYEVCKELEIKVPQHLKVISFSNLAAAALFNPPLSAIVQPAYEIGRESAAILFKIIVKKKLLSSEKKVVIPSHLVIRESTKSKQSISPPVLLK